MNLHLKPNHSKLFYSAALFNWAVALTFLIFYQPVFNLIGLTPVPKSPIYLHLFASLVAIFGIAYYWAGKDLNKNINLVKLGIIGKLTVFFLSLTYYLIGLVSWQLPALASVDLLYSILFINALRHNNSFQSINNI